MTTDHRRQWTVQAGAVWTLIEGVDVPRFAQQVPHLPRPVPAGHDTWQLPTVLTPGLIRRALLAGIVIDVQPDDATDTTGLQIVQGPPDPLTGRRIGVLAGIVADAAPPAVREGVVRQAITATTGQCVCGARVVSVDPHSARLTVLHEPDCPARERTLAHAVCRWLGLPIEVIT
jgi:hypothetical protein